MRVDVEAAMLARAMSETIKPEFFAQLIEADALDTVRVEGIDGGFRILLGFGETEKPLAATRGRKPRIYKRLEKAAAFLQNAGVAHFGVDLSHYVPARKRATPAAKAKAMTAAREAWDAEFLADVTAAREEVLSGKAELIPWTRETNRKVLAAALERHSKGKKRA